MSLPGSRSSFFSFLRISCSWAIGWPTASALILAAMVGRSKSVMGITRLGRQFGVWLIHGHWKLNRRGRQDFFAMTTKLSPASSYGSIPSDAWHAVEIGVVAGEIRQAVGLHCSHNECVTREQLMLGQNCCCLD